MEDLTPYLEPAEIIRITPETADLAASICGSAESEPEKAKALFYWVRDRIVYNPYSPFFLPEHYWPETTLSRGEGYCVQKAALLVALARSQGLPSRLILADIVNHRFSSKLLEYMGANLFVYHAYVEWFINGKWIRATPSFEGPLCEKIGIYPVEFDGTSEAILHRLDKNGQLHIEYVNHHGAYADVPLEEILDAWNKTYSPERVEGWKQGFLSGQSPHKSLFSG